MGVDRKSGADDPAEPHGDLVDRPLQEEIELVGALVAAASAHRGTLTDEEIDRLLGVEHAQDHPEQDEERPGGNENATGTPPLSNLV